jgi:hypothetical protein
MALLKYPLSDKPIVQDPPPVLPPSGGMDWEGGRTRIGTSETLALPGIRDCPNTVDAYPINPDPETVFYLSDTFLGVFSR